MKPTNRNKTDQSSPRDAVTCGALGLASVVPWLLDSACVSEKYGF